MATTGPSDTTIRRLFAVSMNCCAFPGCSTPIVDHDSNTILAEVCHIRARSANGPRYDPTQTDEERHGFDNLVLMCGVHHKLIDSKENLARYTPGALLEIKENHESEARARPFGGVQLTEDQLSALQQLATQYESGSVHNDFRHAVFRVGGEGGQWGGGGGSGGVLTIVGTTRVPAELSLDGGDGQAPGGGGGGAGLVQYLGRPADSDDLAGGLRVNALFLANAASYSGTLMNVLGAGWSYIEVALSEQIRVLLVTVFEMGAVEAETLLRFTITVVSPSGKVAFETPVDIEVPKNFDLVRRVSRQLHLDFMPDEVGIWTITVQSSAHVLGVHHFECRSKSDV